MQKCLTLSFEKDCATLRTSKREAVQALLYKQVPVHHRTPQLRGLPPSRSPAGPARLQRPPRLPDKRMEARANLLNFIGETCNTLRGH